MPRYFESLVVGRPLQQEGLSFIFEPTEPVGGSWRGVLAVEDDSAANILKRNPSAWEITQEQFEAKKKRRQEQVTNRGFVPSLAPQLPAQPIVASAARADRRSESTGESPAPGAADPAVVAAAEIPSVVTAISLKTTSLRPPPEPLVDQQVRDPARRKAA